MNKYNDTNKENPVNQADELEQLFQEIQAEQSKHMDLPKAEEMKIDVLDLPPRSEVHVEDQKLLRIPISKSLLRFIFVIMVISIILYYLINHDPLNLF